MAEDIAPDLAFSARLPPSQEKVDMTDATTARSAGPDQAAKAIAFRALHARPGAFVIPNPWDAGTARILAALGFKTLAAASACLVHALGLHDGVAGRDETLANTRAVVDATDLPVSAGLESGFGHASEAAVETIRLAAGSGCAAVSRPVNVLAGGIGVPSVAAQAEAGVRRISPGSALSRAALGGLVRVAREIREQGTFGFEADALPYAEANGFMLPAQPEAGR